MADPDRSNQKCLRRLLAHRLLLHHLQPSTAGAGSFRQSHCSRAGSSTTEVLHSRARLQEEAVLDAMIDRLILDNMAEQDW
jgi:hypothetical protein